MIVPNGKRRDQVSQGMLQNASVFNHDMFSSIDIEKFSQINPEQTMQTGEPKDLKMEDLQRTMNESNSLPGANPGKTDVTESGEAFIDLSNQISQKVIKALGLDREQGWQGRTEVTDNGQELTGISIKLTKAKPEQSVQDRVEKGGPGYGQPLKNPSPGTITNSV